MRFNLNLEDIKYIKILCKDSSEKVRTIKAAIKSINEREIFACAKFEEGAGIPFPQETTLSIICADGLYRTKTKLKSFRIEEPYFFIALETPQGLEYMQNREYFRVLVDFEADYIVEGRSFKVKTFDISANGISFFLPMHVISENDAQIVIKIEGIEIPAKIRYVRSEKDGENYKLSFTFTQISEMDRDLISQVCIKKQLEERRKRGV